MRSYFLANFLLLPAIPLIGQNQPVFFSVEGHRSSIQVSHNELSDESMLELGVSVDFEIEHFTQNVYTGKLLYQQYFSVDASPSTALGVPVEKNASRSSRGQLGYRFEIANPDRTQSIIYWLELVSGDGAPVRSTKFYLDLSAEKSAYTTFLTQMNEIEKLQQEKKNLEKIVLRVPKEVDIVDVLALDSRLKVQLGTDIDCELAILLEFYEGPNTETARENEENWGNLGTRFTEYDTKHIAEWSGVHHDKEIRLRVSAALNDTTEFVGYIHHLDGTRLRSSKDIEAPRAQPIRLVAIGHDRIEATVELSEPGFVAVEFGKISGLRIDKESKIIKDGSAPRNKFGRVLNHDQLNKTHFFSFPKLDENTEYGLNIISIESAEGLELQPSFLPDGVKETTSAKPTPLAFTGGLDVKFSPLDGITFEWSATKKPAKVSVKLSSRVQGIELNLEGSTDSDPNDHRVRINIPGNELLKAMQNQIVKKDSAKNITIAPEITISMWNEDSKEATVSTTLRIENDLPDLNTIRNNSILDPTTRKSLETMVKAYESYQNGKLGKSKVDWGQIAISGLAFFLGI